MHLKPLGLVVIAASFATPLIWFPPLAAKQDTIALFSQYLGLWALIAMALSQIIATRLSGIESIFGGLDRSYIVTAQVPQGIIFLPQESKCDSLRL